MVILWATTLDVIGDGDGILTVHVSTRFEAGIGHARHAPGLFVASPQVYNAFVNARTARIFAFATLLMVTLVVFNLVAVAVAVADA
jgi:hypothetical protein